MSCGAILEHYGLHVKPLAFEKILKVMLMLLAYDV